MRVDEKRLCDLESQASNPDWRFSNTCVRDLCTDIRECQKRIAELEQGLSVALAERDGARIAYRSTADVCMELERDRERLDWMETQNCNGSVGSSLYLGGPWKAPGVVGRWKFEDLTELGSFESVRDAIDATKGGKVKL